MSHLCDDLSDLAQLLLKSCIDMGVFAQFLAQMRAFMFNFSDRRVLFAAIDEFLDDLRDEFPRDRDLRTLLVLESCASLEKIGITDQGRSGSIHHGRHC